MPDASPLELDEELLELDELEDELDELDDELEEELLELEEELDELELEEELELEDELVLGVPPQAHKAALASTMSAAESAERTGFTVCVICIITSVNLTGPDETLGRSTNAISHSCVMIYKNEFGNLECISHREKVTALFLSGDGRHTLVLSTR